MTPDIRFTHQNRRISPRVMVGLPGSWHPSRASRRGAAWAHRGGAAAEPVRVVDLSVSGAGVLANPEVILHPGAVMCLRFEGGKGHVQIRHIADPLPDDSDADVYYGVTFMRLDERLRAVVHSLVVGRRRNFHSSRAAAQQAASG